MAEITNRNLIVFAGPDRGDRATALHTASDIAPDVRSYDVPDGLDPGLPKAVRMQRGVLRLKKNRALELYSASGDEPVDAVAGLCTGGGVGLAIILNNKRPYPLRDMHFYLHTFADFIRDSSVALAVTRVEPTDSYTIEDYHKELVERQLLAPVFEIDVDDYSDVTMLVQALIFSSLARKSYASAD